MAHIFAVINQKGGSCKTTTSVSLAAALTELESRVLLVDLDNQGSASDWLNIETDGREFLETVLAKDNLLPLIYQSPHGFDFIPNGHYFAGFDNAAPAKVGWEKLLRGALLRLPLENWHYVLLDCPPSLSPITINALVAAQWALIPVVLESLSMKPLRTLLKMIEDVRESYNPELQISGTLACKVDMRENQTKEILAFIGRREDFYKAYIRKNVRLSEAPNAKLPITAYAPDSTGAEDYRALAREFREKHEVTEEKEVAHG